MDQVLRNFDNLDNSIIPPWAKILVEGMQVIINELKSVKELVTRVEILETFKVVSEDTTNKLVNENKNLHDKINVLELNVDDQEQRSRNYCLMLHGVEEIEGEKTDDIILDTVIHDLQIEDFSVNNIQRSHRVGPRPTARNTRNNRV